MPGTKGSSSRPGARRRRGHGLRRRNRSRRRRRRRSHRRHRRSHRRHHRNHLHHARQATAASAPARFDLMQVQAGVGDQGVAGASSSRGTYGTASRRGADRTRSSPPKTPRTLRNVFPERRERNRITRMRVPAESESAWALRARLRYSRAHVRTRVRFDAPTRNALIDGSLIVLSCNEAAKQGR